MSGTLRDAAVTPRYRLEELLIGRIADLLEGSRHVAVETVAEFFFVAILEP